MARSAPSLVSDHPPFVGRNGSENSKSGGHPGAAGSVGCTWEGNGQTILILVRNNTGGLPIQVKQVTFTRPDRGVATVDCMWLPTTIWL